MNVTRAFRYVLLATAACTAIATTSLTAVEVFDSDSCSGAPIQVVFSPTPDCSNVTSHAACSAEAKELGIFASAKCADDPLEFAATTFGDSPYVLVELYTPDSNCESLEGVAAYRIDSNCHPTIDAETSFQVDWHDLSFKVFSDVACSSTPTFQFDLAVHHDECYGGSMKLHVYAEQLTREA